MEELRARKLGKTNAAITGKQPFGILNGRAVILGDDTFLAWVPTGSSNGDLDVRVSRHMGIWGSGLDTGLSFRVLDAQNYFFAYTTQSGGSTKIRSLTVGYYLDGQRTELVTGVNMPSSWTTLRAVTNNSGAINIYADETLVWSTTNNSLLATATAAGLYNNSSSMGLVNRWDNFSVFDAP